MWTHMTSHHKVYSTSIRMCIRSICACIIVCHMDTGVVIVNGGRAYLVVAPQEVYISICAMVCPMDTGRTGIYLITAN